MRIIFRVDASLEIGIGHVMRCLTLADALSEKGEEVEFICRNHEGNLIPYIRSKKYRVHVLDTLAIINPVSHKAANEVVDQLFHADWLGASQDNDANECKHILQNINPYWLVVDHYAIDKTWQLKLTGTYEKLMVIDDLADRHHICDLLLDQTYGRITDEYLELVPNHCNLLLGSEYALLRPEFAEWREFSLKRRMQPEFKKLLITMGGVDPDNMTGLVLDALKICDLPKDLKITVVMGETAPHVKAVTALAESMPYQTKVNVNVEDMAEVMANTDLAIGAAGSTTWERCCLGLPTITVILAENQKKIGQVLFSNKISQVIDIGQFRTSLCEQIINISENELVYYSKNSADIVNGQGVSKTIQYMSLNKL